MTDRLQFDGREWAGALGDIGTSLPLIVGMLLATQLPASGVLIAFGLAQIATGLIYGIPMPVQPLKAMAAVAIAGQVSGGLLQMAGLMIGVLMLVLACTGALGWLGRIVPRGVVRGLQAGLGLVLARAAGLLVSREPGPWSWVAAAVAVLGLVAMRRSGRWPAAWLVIGAGAAWAAWFRVDWVQVAAQFGYSPPASPEWPLDQWPAALTLLVVPQLPLSLGNSLLATRQTARDLFPQRAFSLRRLGLTYGVMNLIVPWLGGVPVCHGCGGLAGNHALGARTGGAVIIYGSLFVAAGLWGSAAFAPLVQAFPAALLGAVLFVEAGALVLLMRDLRQSAFDLSVATAVALLCLLAPQGFLLGLLAGLAAHFGARGAAFVRNACINGD